jgi:DNA polymerase-3 subunit gamma/tau
MSYVVLARKWRPQSFEDLVGQEHVSTTLANAIATKRVAHAFLFTGVRGVGKTTSARILAKALNCEKGPTATPCQTCSACMEITAGNDVDVQEIDGASYNGVDEVRRLQESLPYRPSRDRFKIFIVDEVHMLSNAAWNAFLKTLEEPPPHVKFIFATTEVHKVPVTILSRCQRYDFKLISAQTIATRLRWVLEQEGVAADDAAVATLAREAAGSMRDAMSLLDQVIAWVGASGERLTADGVAKVLGVAERTVLHRMAAAVLSGDAAVCIAIVEELSREGYDLPHVARDFLAHLRDLVVVKVCADPGPLLEIADAEVADVKALAASAEIDDLTRVHQGFSRAFDDIVRGGQPRAAFEMALVRLARRPALLPVDELLRRLGELERRLASPAAAGSGGTSGAPRGSGEPPRSPPGAAPPPRARTDAEGPSPRASFQAPPARAPHEASGAHARLESVPTHPDAAARRPAPAEVALFEAPATPPPGTTPRPETPPIGRDGAKPAASPLEKAALPAAPPIAIDLSGWRAVLDRIRGKRPAVASVLEHAVVLEFGSERVSVAYEQGSFLLAQAGEKGAIDLLKSAVHEHFGAPASVSLDVVSSRQGRVTVAQIDAAERKDRVEAARRAVTEHPLVTAAIQVLGAELRDVRLSQDGDGA